jgi:hypothetical protein
MTVSFPSLMKRTYKMKTHMKLLRGCTLIGLLYNTTETEKKFARNYKKRKDSIKCS